MHLFNRLLSKKSQLEEKIDEEDPILSLVSGKSHYILMPEYQGQGSLLIRIEQASCDLGLYKISGPAIFFDKDKHIIKKIMPNMTTFGYQSGLLSRVIKYKDALSIYRSIEEKTRMTLFA